MSRIAVIVGHSRADTFCQALAESYAAGARSAGHQVEMLQTAHMQFDPILREAYVRVQPLEPDLADAHRAIMAADHLVIVFPLWLGGMPAILKGFLERILQPDLIEPHRAGKFVQLLKGKSARVIMTMGMPGLVYRWWYGAHALQALKRNILEFMGVSPVRSTLFGMIEAVGAEKRRQWLDEAEALGRAGA
ncbi:MAG: NAD(P)H-dependent oxidoreductase [Hyphomicrobiaceae bacterium]